MASWSDVREFALAMPGVEEFETRGDLAWRTGASGKGFVWERPLRKSDLAETGPQQGPIAGVRVADEGEKLALIDGDPDVFFTIHHFDGYPAVLLHLDRISRERLGETTIRSSSSTTPARIAPDQVSGNDGEQQQDD